MRVKLKRSKKRSGALKVDKTPSTDDTLTSDHHDDRSSLSSEMREDRDDNILIKKFSRDIDNSALSTFARMSTTIAENLTEEEFGLQKNRLYCPSMEPKASQIVHPVVCKRDIYVESVTPQKKKGRRKSSKSIYHNRASYGEIRDIRQTTTTTPLDKSIHSNISQKNQEEERESPPTEMYMESNQDHLSYLPSYSISGSMMFRKNTNHLKVETGRIVVNNPDILQPNQNRLHRVPPENHHMNSRILKDGKPPRFANAFISPSSTVSSLTIPADLEEQHGTPRHARLSPSLEGIEEFGSIITSKDVDENEGDYSEI